MKSILTDIITDSRIGKRELILKFGDRFQAVAFMEFDSKEDISRKLHILAENIANDELIGKER